MRFGVSRRSRLLFQVLSPGFMVLALINSHSNLARGDENKAPAAGQVNFTRQIRPILSNHCFRCHGPDQETLKADLRLDVKDAVFAPQRSLIVPGDRSKSVLFQKISASAPEEKMPPEGGKPLSPAQIELIGTWIDQGANWNEHWAFVTPKPPEIPTVQNALWTRNAIDRFVLSTLEKNALSPQPEADRETLIRRVTLDLTGLPPTPEEVDVFLLDNTPDAYEKLVDRLLMSPHYGERMALDWLDAARFADTHGYHIDSGRDMTRWRDWVIASFNDNMPFDRFTIEQIAGDLLPNATLSQRVASGFNRNHMINFEGGAIPEEYLNNYIVDRVNTTGTVWLGLTVNCSQCHDHKYDPIGQREFYQLYAFFHNLPELGLDGVKGNAKPFIKAPSAEEQQQLDALAAKLTALQQQLGDANPEVDAAQVAWESSDPTRNDTKWAAVKPSQVTSAGEANLRTMDDASILAFGKNPGHETYTIVLDHPGDTLTGLKIEALPDDGLKGKGPGRSNNGNAVLTNVSLSAAPLAGGDAETIKLATAAADFHQTDFSPEKAIDADPASGWGIYPQTGVPHWLVVLPAAPITKTGGMKLTVTLEFKSPYFNHQFGKMRISTTGSAEPKGTQSLSEDLLKALALPRDQRTPEQAAAIRDYYRVNVSEALVPLRNEIAIVKTAQAELDQRIPTAMIMEELPQPRDTFMLTRGQYDKPGEKVLPGVPAALPPFPDGSPKNRLGLAQWLVSSTNPLTPRVIVNRYWQSYFGTGIVKTSEDFGSQGELPSHPDLLDFLSTHFVQSGWDVKGIQRMIVTSSTYRQSSHVSKESIGRDPENRLLARGPRLRLPAEFIRDQALFVSGLLNAKIGGASVSPYQPAGIWEDLAYREDGANFTAQSYSQSHGEDLYRRTMYTFWKRTAPPPTLVTFDAPDRETCTVRRSRTNTPLQALVLMNDPTYVEAARKFAERIIQHGGESPERRIEYAFRNAIARRPSGDEKSVLLQVLNNQLALYRADPQTAEKLVQVGESPRNANLDVAELAAWTMIANVILNLDETLTKG